MTYIEPFTGGCLIGLGSLIAMAASGKIPGISGVVAKIIRPKPGDVAWRLLFIAGLILGAAIVFTVRPETREYVMPKSRGWLAVAIAGLLVGMGTRLGGGCTSGHGVCGIGSGAKDAIIYTLVFMATGAATVLIWNLLSNGGVIQ